jgi:hypothetical protein
MENNQITLGTLREAKSELIRKLQMSINGHIQEFNRDYNIQLSDIRVTHIIPTEEIPSRIPLQSVKVSIKIDLEDL